MAGTQGCVACVSGHKGVWVGLGVGWGGGECKQTWLVTLWVRAPRCYAADAFQRGACVRVDRELLLLLAVQPQLLLPRVCTPLSSSGWVLTPCPAQHTHPHDIVVALL